MTGVRLRAASGEDAPAIAALHADSWRRHYRGAYSDAFLDGDVGADRLQVWTERLTAGDGHKVTLIAEDGDKTVGFVHVAIDDDADWGSLVDNLHVVFERKRGGIGRLLMAGAAEAVLQRSETGLYLWVLEQNASAQAFYSALGGKSVGRRAVQAPGGIADRLNGSPIALRIAWPDPTVLLSLQ